MESLSIRIRGKVQGVFFRHESQKIAESLGLSGFARNEKDGSVFIEVEGEREALQKFLLWTRTGPRYAKVEDIQPTWSEALKGHKGFVIQ